jgi:hypothetical protein
MVGPDHPAGADPRKPAAGSPSEIDAAFGTFIELRAGALVVAGDPFLFTGVLKSLRWRPATRCPRSTHGPKSRRVTYMLLPVFLLSPLLVRSPVPLSRLSELGSYGRPFAAEAADFAAARRLLAERPGAAICESLLLCWSAGKSLVLDPFNSYQQFRTGSLDETGLLAAIARRGFAAIQVRSPIRFQTDHTGRERIDLHPPIRFTNNFYHAVLANYELASSSAIPIYVPRRATPSE